MLHDTNRYGKYGKRECRRPGAAVPVRHGGQPGPFRVAVITTAV